MTTRPPPVSTWLDSAPRSSAARCVARKLRAPFYMRAGLFIMLALMTLAGCGRDGPKKPERVAEPPAGGGRYVDDAGVSRTLFQPLGLLSAGVALALRDPLVNLAGWVFILSRHPFQVGDRIEENEILALLHVNSEEHLDQACGMVEGAYTIDPSGAEHQLPVLIVERIVGTPRV